VVKGKLMKRALILCVLVCAGCGQTATTQPAVSVQESIRAVAANVEGARTHVEAADVEVVAITKGDSDPARRASVAHAELIGAKGDLSAATSGTATAITASNKADASLASIKSELDDLKASRSAADAAAWRRYLLGMTVVFALAAGFLVFWEVPGSLIPRVAIAAGAGAVTATLTYAAGTWLYHYWWIVAGGAVISLIVWWLIKTYGQKKAVTAVATAVKTGEVSTVALLAAVNMPAVEEKK
jgi:hypothetical protein